MSDLTKQLLASMLKENTGKHMLDSGGAYGRNWERNQTKDFEVEQKVTITDWGIEVSLYHYLSDLLELDDVAIKLNKFVDDWNVNDPNNYIHWTGEMLEHLEDIDTYEIFGSEFHKVSDSYNSYNGDCFFSQTIQYFTAAIDEDNVYIFIQIHGGADVRGGYTDGRWFKLNGYLEWTPSIHARINGVDLDTYYDGYHLTVSDTDDNKDLGLEIDSEFELTEDMNVEYAEWNEIDESMTYIYCD